MTKQQHEREAKMCVEMNLKMGQLNDYLGTMPPSDRMAVSICIGKIIRAKVKMGVRA